jgi:phenylpropionate dioxygenase-like ring-hydroxylating dioxygenase large terminal subunit
MPSRTKCILMVSATIQQGMLWVWPESGPAAFLESAANPPYLVPEADDPEWGSAGG